MTAAAIPAREDFHSPDHTIVHVTADSRPDGLNRLQFTAFWLDDYLTPAGVRGQVFYADLDARTAEWGAQGHKVTVVRVGGVA